MTQIRSGEEELPSFSVQVASQLGGVRGIAESSIPVIVFVVVNLIASLQPALIAAVGVAVASRPQAVWNGHAEPRHHLLVNSGLGSARSFFFPCANSVYSAPPDVVHFPRGHHASAVRTTPEPRA